MPGFRRNPPSYRLHKASGNAVVTLIGKDVYLGRFGARSSLAEYDRVIAEWLSADRTHVSRNDPAVSIAELVNAFRKSDAISDSHQHDYRAVMSLLVRTNSRRPVTDFGPLALKGVRKAMIDAGWNRQTISQRTYMLRRIFRWGVEHEMVPVAIYDALLAVEGLRAGKSTAPEPEAVEPVAVAHVEACLPFAPTTVQSMVKVQALTGMRPGELCDMRTGQIERTGKVWIYRPGSHKTAYKGKSREIAIGPKAQVILAPYLKADPAAYIFTPRESETIRRQAAHTNRKTPLKYGNFPGSNRKSKAACAPGGPIRRDGLPPRHLPRRRRRLPAPRPPCPA